MRHKSEYHINIKKMAKDERPQEKMIKYGSESLSNAELVGIIIRTGNKEATSVDLGRKILETFDNDLTKFQQMEILELERDENLMGVGVVKACQIKAAIELGIRVNRKAPTSMKITSPNLVADLLMDEMQYLKQEVFKILLLDTKNYVLKIEEVTIGTLDASLVHPREVFVKAIKQHAASIILVHNHPSGCIEPSTEDKIVTQRLKEAGELLGIPILDHVIIGRGCFISFKQDKLL
ncbi:MAG: RadC family protein [Eubacteriaceae bacterium]